MTIQYPLLMLLVIAPPLGACGGGGLAGLINDDPSSDDTPTSYANDTTAPIDCGSEAELEELALTNDARREAGHPPLTCDPHMAYVARAHSQDMCEAAYFDHTNLDGESPFDRMENAGIGFRRAGENIAAGGATALATHNQWMNSPGHRSNILSPNYGRIGVGYFSCAAGPYTHYWTQVFAD